MLYIISLVLVAIWLLGVLGVYTLGGAYSAGLIALAVVLTVVAMLSGRRGLA